MLYQYIHYVIDATDKKITKYNEQITTTTKHDHDDGNTWLSQWRRPTQTDLVARLNVDCRRLWKIEKHAPAAVAVTSLPGGQRVKLSPGIPLTVLPSLNDSWFFSSFHRHPTGAITAIHEPGDLYIATIGFRVPVVYPNMLAPSPTSTSPPNCTTKLPPPTIHIFQANVFYTFKYYHHMGASFYFHVTKPNSKYSLKNKVTDLKMLAYYALNIIISLKYLICTIIA